MKKYQNGGDTRPVQNAPKVTISPSSGSSKTSVKKVSTKKANPPRGTMDLIRGSKKSDYIGTVTQAAKKGGAVKKYQDGGKTGAQLKKEGAAMKAKGQAMKAEGQAMKLKGQGQAMKAEGIKQKELGTSIKNYPGQSAVDKAIFGEYIIRKPNALGFKTGGMVNSNAKVSALKSAGSHGVKSGVNPRAAASKVARGKVGGISTAPRTAVPKAKYGMSMRKK